MTADLQPLLVEVAAIVLARTVECDCVCHPLNAGTDAERASRPHGQSNCLCGVTFRVPDPRFAPLVEALTEACELSGYHKVGKPAKFSCPDCHGTGRRVRDVSTVDTGAVLGAMAQIWGLLLMWQDKGCASITYQRTETGASVEYGASLKEAALRAVKAALEKKT